MNTVKICSGCQKPVAPNAPDGLCPECLLKAGLGTGVDLDQRGNIAAADCVGEIPEVVNRLIRGN